MGAPSKPSGQTYLARPPTQVSSSRTRETISVSILCQVILLNNHRATLPLNNYRAIQTQCQVMQSNILFLRTFIIPLPVATMGWKGH